MRIALIAEFDPSYEPHILTGLAIGHAARELDLHVEFDWVSTADISERLFEEFQAVWFAPGSPYKDMGKTLWAIQHARVVGSDAEGEARVMEIYEHPFYIGTLYVPQSRSHEGSPHPLVTKFLLAV